MAAFIVLAQSKARCGIMAPRCPTTLHCMLLFVACLVSQAGAAEKVDLVRVDKSDRLLELLGGGKTIRAYPIALGDNPVGHKQQEGDERTPEGRYLLDWHNPQSGYFRSIHVSYPNAADEAAARRMGVKPGGMIMIHGQPNGYGWWGWLFQMFDWTDGCIAVDNAAMAEIWDMVPDGTPPLSTKDIYLLVNQRFPCDFWVRCEGDQDV